MITQIHNCVNISHEKLCDMHGTLKPFQGMTNGVRAFMTNKNPTLFLAHEQQTFYASMCTNTEFSYFMFVM